MKKLSVHSSTLNLWVYAICYISGDSMHLSLRKSELIKEQYSPELIESTVSFCIDLRKFSGTSDLSDTDVSTTYCIFVG